MPTTRVDENGQAVLSRCEKCEKLTDRQTTNDSCSTIKLTLFNVLVFSLNEIQSLYSVCDIDDSIIK